MNAPATPALHAPAIGTLFAGGMVLAHVFVSGNPFAVIVPPKALRMPPSGVMAWNKSLKRVDGARSYFDGLANTRAMAEAGSDLAKWALEQRIEGFDDWHIGSRQDLLAIKGSLLETVPAYQDSPDAFDDEWHWSSTQDELSDDWAWLQHFGYGGQFHGHKSDEYRAFVLRREPIR